MMAMKLTTFDAARSSQFYRINFKLIIAYYGIMPGTALNICALIYRINFLLETASYSLYKALKE
jgi:hypothetical protein